VIPRLPRPVWTNTFKVFGFRFVLTLWPHDELIERVVREHAETCSACAPRTEPDPQLPRQLRLVPAPPLAANR
jgi:hypothetical protein